MTGNLDRDALAALLESLGDDNDAEALSAARKAHALVVEAGVSWSDLIASDQTLSDHDVLWDEDRQDGHLGDGDGRNSQDDIGPPVAEERDRMNPTSVTASPAGSGRGNSDTLRLLDRLLAQEVNDPVFCAELEGYKQDIANGEFDDRDRAYIRDLYDRLRKTPAAS